MPSSYTSSLRLTLPVQGELAGSWGNTVNTGITQLVDASVAGTASITMTAANYTLTNNNGATDESRSMFLVLGGTPGNSFNVIVPAVSKLYFVTNGTGFAQTVKTASGSGISVPNGARMALRCDGTDVVEALNSFGSLTINTGKVLLSNGQSYAIKSSGGANNDVIGLTAGNVLVLGGGGATDSIQFWNQGLERMRLDSSGNLGIGTSSPASKLDVSGAFGTGTTAATISNTTGFSASNIARIDFKLNNSFGGLERTAAIWSVNPNAAGNNGGALVFGVSSNGTATTPSEVARFDSSGNLGLGVTPSAWGGGFRALQIYGRSSIASDNANRLWLNSDCYNNGTNWIYGASGVQVSQYQAWNGQHAWYTAPSGTAGNAISFTQAMTLGASGNLGIGTTSVPQRLTIEGSAQINSSGTFYLNNSDNTNQYYWQNIGATGANNATLILSRTNAGETLRITSGGDLLVGTTTLAGAGGISFQYLGSVGVATVNNNNAAATGHVFSSFRRSSVEIGSITQNGTTAILYNTTSDRRLKGNIAPAPSASDVIDAIEIVSHDWKSAPDEHVTYGVIAQDLALVAPQAVLQGDDGDEIEKTWGVDYSKLVPMLIKEIQSLRARVAALEAA